MLDRWPMTELRRRPDRFYAFLSYSTRDPEIAFIKSFLDEYLRTLLSTVPIVPIFYDGIYIPEGHPELREYLLRCIRGSDFTVALISAGYVSSLWCRLEWEAAEEAAILDGKHAPVLPIWWKRYRGDERTRVFETRKWVEIANEVQEGDYKAAINKAIHGTLGFLDHVYGVSSSRPPDRGSDAA